MMFDRRAIVVGAALALAATSVVSTSGFVAAETVNVVEIDFNDGTWGDWTQSGGPGLSVVGDPVDPSNQVLQVADRVNDYDGIKSPTMFAAGTEYTFSMRVMLATPGTAEARFVTDPNYQWIGNTTVTGDSWTTLTGSHVAGEPFAVFIGTGAHSEAGGAYTYLVDDIVVSADELPPPEPGVIVATDFENGLDGWTARNAQGTPTVAVTTDEAHGGAAAALVADRTGQGDGIGRDVTGLMAPGTTYEITAWVKFAGGSGGGDVWLSMQRVNAGADAFDTVGQFTGVTDGEWREVRASYTMAPADTAFLYFETNWPDGTNASFLVDDIVIEGQAPPVVEDLPPLRDTVDFGMGVAIDSRETAGSAAELLLRHFDQVTPENHMKPEAWYDAAGAFQVHPEATAIMEFAQANSLGVYGHTLVWHSQTPAWFFARADGTPLTDSAADQELLRTRMRDHIFAIAEALAAAYGPFGSDTNPLVAWDVVNEVIADGTTEADGLRRSRWYDVLGESYIDLAFQLADEAFNQTYAAAGIERPVELAINDYNTEQDGKRARLRALVERLLARGVPVDIVGHQFHLSLSTPVSALDATLDAFADLPVQQVVSELDVTTGTPVTDALLIDQGYYYRDAFRIFREHTAELFSVTVWGLTDNRSWRSAAGDPLLFDAALRAKPAYYGASDAELPPRQRTAFVFQPSDPADLSIGAPEWDRLPLHPVEDVAAFQLRWSGDTLTAYVEVADTAVDATDAIELAVDGAIHDVSRSDGVDTPDGWAVVVPVPLPGAGEGALVEFDLRVIDGAVTTAWNEAGAFGTLTLVEQLSYTTAVEAPTAPAIDAAVDPVWGEAHAVVTDTLVDGAADGATAEVRTLWTDHTLYVLAEVTDSTPDVSSSDPWVQDSIEIFVDAGNYKNGPYRYDDTQIRISAVGDVSFGTGDQAFQAARLTSATSATAGGYRVEAAISLLEYGGPGSFHGLDFQVNDGADGVRTSIRTWADPTGIGYQTTARWGVVELVEGPLACDTTISGRHAGVVMGVGTTCIEPGADVRGGVVVGPGGSLIVTDATVRGGVVVAGAEQVSITGSDVRGAVRISGAAESVEFVANSVAGSVDVHDNQVAGGVLIGDNAIRGALACSGNDPVPTDGGAPNQVNGAATGQCAALTT